MVFLASTEVRDFETRTRTDRDKTPAVTLAPKSPGPESRRGYGELGEDKAGYGDES